MEEFINFRGKNLPATMITVGGQDFLIAAVGDRQDSAIADIYAQQNIEIVPGLKVMERKSGTLFEILSQPSGHLRHVRIKDTRRNLTPINVTEDRLRQDFRFVG
ncbi:MULTISPECIES: hypothetical protein [unclassified Microcoleus]|uniref:hypothetical protein n=1 Tax=unclassified Microcoleus TaxID=2642155 RepID=UPI002FD68EB4